MSNYKHKPRKRFGQNFLHDHGVIDRIVHAISPRVEQHLVEIGPGQGALTLPVLSLTGALDIIELDRDLVAFWQQQELEGELRVHAADALKFDFSSLCHDDEKLRLIGNLPYNISSPLIFHLLEASEYIDDMTFMLQKEVANRIAAPPGSKGYGRLSVMVQYRCEVEKLFDVGPEAFEPPPKVDSSIIRFYPRPPRLKALNLQHFEGLVASAFSQRRKTLRNTLKGLLTETEMLALGIDPGLRAETISLDDFVRMSNACLTDQAQVRTE